MRFRTFAFACALLLGANIAAKGAPLEAYGELPTLDDIALSPDGSKLAYVGQNDKGRFVVVQSVSGALVDAMRIGEQKVRDLRWGDDTHVLITQSVTTHAAGIMGPRQEFFESELFDTATGRQVNLMARADGRAMNIVAGEPQRRIVDGHPVIFVKGVYFPEEEGVSALYSIDVASGATARVATGTRNTREWVVDSAGKVMAQVEYDDSTEVWGLGLKTDSGWQGVFAEKDAVDVPDIRGITAGGTQLLVQRGLEGQWDMLGFSLSDGKAVKPEQEKLEETVEDPVSGQIIGERLVDHDVSYRFFSPGDVARWAKVLHHFPGEQVELESWSDDHDRIVVHVTGLVHGDAFELVDVPADTVKLVGPAYVQIGVSDIARVTQFTYPAADGRMIDAYLTLPSQRNPENLPLIVMPHGGPAARDEPGFDWWAQALASRGYAVLQPQFRGSDGFGWDLLSAGFGQWGRKMQTDLSDGARALVHHGIVDPKRVCIVGASYGGYAALAAATIDPSAYRCAVSVGGISDPASFVKWKDDRSRQSDSIVDRFWMRFLGATSADDPTIDAISPLKQVARASVPVLLIHGQDDTVVPIEQSEDMARALKKAGKPVELVALDGEDHWLSRSATRLAMLSATVKFLDANNPP